MSQTINLNMTPGLPPQTINFSQYDVGRVVQVCLKDESGAYSIPSGATVTLEATKPSGLGFSEECEYSDDTVTITSTATVTDEYGLFPCEIKIEYGSILLGSCNMNLYIEKSPHLDGTTDGIAEHVVSTITALVERAEAAAETVLEILQLREAFDGTKATYDKVMRRWFLSNGVYAMTSAGITKLCEKWYEISKEDWEGYTEFALPTISSLSTGTKGGDNLGLSCTPSTNTVAGQDDYAGLPLFACVNVNYEVDPDTLDIIITAIEGISDNFTKYDPETFVGVMQMSGYHYWYDTDATYVHGYADHVVSNVDCRPLPEAVRIDGTVRPFVVHGKYMSKLVNGKMTSYSGVVPTAYVMSHNTTHTYAKAIGSQYSGGCIVDLAFIILMVMLKYASMTLDGIMQGCCAYNGVYYAQVSETDVNRVILPSNCIIEEGSAVLIGTYNGSSADRGVAANYNISTNAGAIVTAVETITISGTTYKAVYVDLDDFDTTANGTATTGSTIVNTFHWPSGSTDAVLGNDGSPNSNTNGRNPYKIQGIERMVGGYEILADIILNFETIDSATHYVPYVVKRSANQTTSITSNYEGISDLALACPSTVSWQYGKRNKFAGDMFMQSELGGSSSTFLRDGAYMNANGTTGTREYLAFGNLYSGADPAGLSCLLAASGLGTVGWGYLARLSPNGNRGEWAA